MSVAHPLYETARERLLRVAAGAESFQWQASSSLVMWTLGIGIFVALIVGIGFVGGMLGAEIMATYSRSLIELALRPKV